MVPCWRHDSSPVQCVPSVYATHPLVTYCWLFSDEPLEDPSVYAVRARGRQAVLIDSLLGHSDRICFVIDNPSLCKIRKLIFLIDSHAWEKA